MSNVVVIGTILHQDSLLANLVDPNRNSGWTGKKYKAVKKFSDNPQLWEQWSSIFCRREEHEGGTGPEAAKLYFEANRKEMLKGTEVLWPAWENYYQLMVMRESE